jgi:glycosyltransferase involved in cell wall biosynthesis
MKQKLKVLMLGWEFPPIINGGLGVACFGLSKSLAEIVDLSLIIPKAEVGFSVDNINLIGLNQLDIRQFKNQTTEEHNAYDIFNDVTFVNANFTPYENYDTVTLENKKVGQINTLNKSSQSEVTIDDILSFDAVGDIYGTDIWDKIQKYAKIVSKIAQEREFDVIHAHDWMTFIAGLQIKHESGKPLVLHIHSLETDRSGIGSRGGVYQLEKYAMELADLVIPVSNYTANVITHHYGIDANKVVPVHNGVEPVIPFKTEKPFPEKLILFLGRLTGQKGPGYFLETAQKVIANYPNVRFVMAGTGDKLKSLIEAGAFKQIGDKFHFTGFLSHDKVLELLSMADVYCMPSVSEPFGISALEAAQFGVPCVISNQSGVSEVLPSALSADFFDVTLMAKHIVNLLNERDLNEKVVKAGFEDLKKVSWEYAANKVLTLYYEKLSL